MVKFDDIYLDAAVEYCILRGYEITESLLEDPGFKEIVRKWYNSLEYKIYISSAEKNIPAQTL